MPGIDSRKALRVIALPSGIAISHALKKSQRLRLKFVWHTGSCKSFCRLLRRQVKPQGQRRLDQRCLVWACLNHALELAQNLFIKAPATALVSKSRVCETVSQDHIATRQ